MWRSEVGTGARNGCAHNAPTMPATMAGLSGVENNKHVVRTPLAKGKTAKVGVGHRHKRSMSGFEGIQLLHLLHSHCVEFLLSLQKDGQREKQGEIERNKEIMGMRMRMIMIMIMIMKMKICL